MKENEIPSSENNVKKVKSSAGEKGSKKKTQKSEKIRKYYFRTFYYAFCIAFIVFGTVAVIYFLYCQDKNIFGFSTKYYEKAENYVTEGNLTEAEKTLYSCIDYDPGYTDARLMLIDILITESKYPEALTLVQESIDLQPRNENYYVQYIKALTGQNKIVEAMDFINGISANYIVVKISEQRPSNFVSSPDPGTYDDTINVVFEKTDDSEIYYTLDGTVPNLNSYHYTGNPITVSSGTQTIRAFAINKDGLVSDEYTATYRIYKSNSQYIFIDEKMEEIVRGLIGKSTGAIIYSDLEKIVTLKNTSSGAGSSLKITTLEDLGAMENLSAVELTGETEIDSLYTFATLKNVKSLTLSGCGISDDMLGDLSSMIWLESLDLSNNYITSVSSLSPLIKLKQLSLAGNKIKDIADLQGSMVNLQSLDLSRNMLSDIITVGSFTKLRILNVSENLVEDISALSSLSLLENLDLSLNSVRSLDGISRLPQITTLNLSGTKITGLSRISEYTKLINLNISHTAIEGLNNLRNISTLTTLNISQTAISDFSPLASMNVKNLTAASCDLTSVSGLADASSLETLDLSHNMIVDVQPLTKLTRLSNLNIQGNYPQNLSVLENCASLTTVNCSDTTVSSDDINALERANINVIRTATSVAD